MIVISGATGHVGSAIAKELLGKNQKVKFVRYDVGVLGPPLQVRTGK